MAFNPPAAVSFQNLSYWWNYIAAASRIVMTSLSDDTAPTLGGNLNLNGHTVNGLGNVLARATYSTYNSTNAVGTNPPSSATGLTIFSQSITTTQNNSFVEILCVAPVVSCNGASAATLAVFNGSTLLDWSASTVAAANALASATVHIPGVQLGAAGSYTINVKFMVTVGSGNTVFINGTSAAGFSGSSASLIIKEYAT